MTVTGSVLQVCEVIQKQMRERNTVYKSCLDLFLQGPSHMLLSLQLSAEE